MKGTTVHGHRHTDTGHKDRHRAHSDRDRHCSKDTSDTQNKKDSRIGVHQIDVTRITCTLTDRERTR